MKSKTSGIKKLSKATQVAIYKKSSAIKGKEKTIHLISAYEYTDYDEGMNMFEVIWWILKRSPAIISIFYHIILLTERLKMFKKDPKTTVLAIIKIVCAILAIFGVIVPAEVSAAFVTLCTAGYFIFDFIQGLLTKDKDEPEVK